MDRSAHRSAAVAAAKSAAGLLITAVLGGARLLDIGVLLAGCGGTGGQASGGPSIGTTATAVSSGGPGAALHAAAQCIRVHGLPSYPDPVLTASGQVYSDLQTFRLVPDQRTNGGQVQPGLPACGAGLPGGAGCRGPRLHAAKPRHRRLVTPSHHHKENVMKRYAIAAAAAVAALLAGCGGQSAASPAVPSLGAHAGGTASSGRTAALRAAAQCIREHGISSYQDPVLTPSGAVYSDLHSFQVASQSTVQAVRAACRTAMAHAGLNPEREPPAPAQLVEAGVLANECMRAHGLTHMPDPTAQSLYVPGHGFQSSGNVMPAGGKGSPVYQRAAHACRSLLDAEIAASTMASLGNEG